MKTVLLIIALLGSVAQADKAIIVMDNHADDANTALYFSCKAMVDYLIYRKPCDRMTQQLREGAILNKREYHSWCDPKAAALKEAQRQAAIYKKAAHKNINYKNCPEESTL